MSKKSIMVEIQRMPTKIDNIHESCFRSYHVLVQVLEMVKRGDSKETIVSIADLLKSNPEDERVVSPDRKDD